VNSSSTYAYYGSLRRGMINYRKFGTALDFLYQDVMPGFRMYALESFPYAVKTGNASDVITVEVFRVTNRQAEKSIHALEMREGYYYDEVMIRDELIGIYLFKNAGSEPLVESGDWVHFFGAL
jgi:gamma-glutamylcyclotransferase (GGCT)/AIG2-like uncharacterized protein YtfP